MKDKIRPQKNTIPPKGSHRRGVSHLKKIFNYLLFLGIVESGNAQTKFTDDHEKSVAKTPTEAVITDHKSLINANADSLDIEIIRNELLMEINQERAKTGLQPLVSNEYLDQAAMEYAQYMDKNSWYQHADKNGIKGSARAKKFGYKKVFMGENIHNGPRSIYYVMQDRMGSALHANNILGEFTEDIGIGYCNGYWVVDFGGRYPWIKRDEQNNK